ncbi:peptidoglycan-binding protein [Streptomyces sp. NPDC046831]|uniref:peptidoglycan-binding domain-containing protein n=1 Tax=Streptomyces sp. NPDC046831 TaxID=3154805 RepID=UPI0033F5AA80
MRQRGLVTSGAVPCILASLGLAVPQATAAASPPCSHISPAFQPVLTEGRTGPAVEQAQCLSNMWGGEPPKLPLSGVFDSAMTEKIEWIQGCHGLPPSGVIEGRTWHVLYKPALDCYAPYPPP